MDLTEELTICILAAIAITAMAIFGTEAKEVVSAVAGGLVGYLSKRDKG